MMGSHRKLFCLVMTLSCLSVFIGCSSNEEDQNFTGTFEQTVNIGRATHDRHSFVLSQNEDQLEGTYTKGGLMAGSMFSALYHVGGTVITLEVAELSLTLMEASHSGFESPITVHVVLKNHGDLLYINEWDLDVPRVK